MSILKRGQGVLFNKQSALSFIVNFKNVICENIEKERDSPNLPEAMEKLQNAMKLIEPSFDISSKRIRTNTGESKVSYDLPAVCEEVKKVLTNLEKQTAPSGDPNVDIERTKQQLSYMGTLSKHTSVVDILKTTYESMVEYYLTMCAFGKLDKLNDESQKIAMTVMLKFLASRGYVYPTGLEGFEKTKEEKEEQMRIRIEARRKGLPDVIEHAERKSLMELRREMKERLCNDLKNYLGESVIRKGKLPKSVKKDIRLGVLNIPFDVFTDILLLTGRMQNMFAKKYFPMRFGSPSFTRETMHIFNTIKEKKGPKMIESRLDKVILDLLMIFDYGLSIESIMGLERPRKNLYVRTLDPLRHNYDIGLLIQYDILASVSITDIAKKIVTEEDRNAIFNTDLPEDTVLVALRPELINAMTDESMLGSDRIYINNEKNRNVIVSYIKGMLLNDLNTKYSGFFQHQDLQSQDINMNVTQFQGESQFQEEPQFQPAPRKVDIWAEFDTPNFKIHVERSFNKFHLKRDVVFKITTARIVGDIGEFRIPAPAPLVGLFNVLQNPPRKPFQTVEIEQNISLLTGEPMIISSREPSQAKLITTTQNALCEKWFRMERKYLRDVRFEIEPDENYFKFQEDKDVLQEIKSEQTNLEELWKRLIDNIGDSDENPENLAAKIITSNCFIHVNGNISLDSRYNQFLILYQYLYQDIGFSFHTFNKICRVDENARLKYSL